MRTTIDAAGRVVVPKSLRADVGLVPGEVEIEIDGAGIRISPVAEIDLDDLIERDGRLVIPAQGGEPMTAEQLREFRLADQR